MDECLVSDKAHWEDRLPHWWKLLQSAPNGITLSILYEWEGIGDRWSSHPDIEV